MDCARGIRVNRNCHRRDRSLMLVLVLVLFLHRVLATTDAGVVVALRSLIAFWLEVCCVVCDH